MPRSVVASGVAWPPAGRRYSGGRVKKFVMPVLAGLVMSVVPLAGDAVSAASVPAGASAYTPIAPTRIADTRPEAGGFGFERVGPTTIRVKVTGRAGVPANATAAVLNIASVNAVAAGFLTAYPTGAPRPLAASLNVDMADRIIANMVTVQLGANGSVDLYTNVAMNLVVDLAGTYASVSSDVRAGRLVTIAGGARRALDTRDANRPFAAGERRTVDVSGVGVPADATAVVVNLAAIDAAIGYWTGFPSGDALPLASSVNIDEPGQTRNAQGIIRLNPGPRSFDVFSQSGGHLAVDVVGWYTGDSSPSSTDGLFVPTSPTRQLDTRDSFPLAPWGGTTVEFGTGSTVPVSVAAVAMNIAVANPWYVGFITAHPAGLPRPNAANLNVTAFDQIISNHAIVRVGTRGIALYTQNGTHMIADVTGWFLGTPDTSTQPVAPIPTHGPTTASSVWAGSIGSVPIRSGKNINTIVDTGVAALWAGFGTLGTYDHNIYFAHRTSHGGPFRNIDQMVVGSQFVITGADGLEYVYLVTRLDVIVPTPSVLLNIVMNAGPVTATLVACHPPHSTRYRIAVTGRLIDVNP